MDKLNLIFNGNLIRKSVYPFDSPLRISIKDDFFTSSAVLFSIIPHENKTYELILIHRSDRGTKHRGEMSFPGGKFDPQLDSSLKDTALRETEEEIGVSPKNIKIFGCLDDFPTMTRYIITPFVGIINKDQVLIKDNREVQRILKIPISFFTSKIHFREEAVDIERRKFPIFYYNYIDDSSGQKYTIWGATAYLITVFIEKVYGFNMSESGLERFQLKTIKQLKEYIKIRNQITKKF